MCEKGTRTTHASLCHIFRIQDKNYISHYVPQGCHIAFKAIQSIDTLFNVPQVIHLSIDIKMQFTLNVLAIFAATANIATAAAPRRYAPVQYRPAQYGGNTVPWTSSTKYKPSTWTSTSPTVITSVYTTFKPATTSVVTTITTTYVGK